MLLSDIIRTNIQLSYMPPPLDRLGIEYSCYASIVPHMITSLGAAEYML